MLIAPVFKGVIDRVSTIRYRGSRQTSLVSASKQGALVIMAFKLAKG